MTEPTTQQERDLFEAFCIKRWAGDRNALEIRDDGEYVNGRVQFAWEAFQVARSLPPADAPSVRELQPEDWLNEGDLAALRRLDDLFSDGEGYDLPKAQMSRLAEIGCIRHCGSGRYEITSFGMKLVGSWRRLPLETCAEANERSRIDAALAHQEGGK